MVSKIREIAKAKGLTIKQVEEQCGIGKKSIYDWDKNRPSVDKVKRVADLLGTTMEDLIAEDP